MGAKIKMTIANFLHSGGTEGRQHPEIYSFHEPETREYFLNTWE
jgi:hypothetical protein